MKTLFASAAGAALLLCAGAASAAVIPGPLLTDDDSGWTASGLSFQAQDNATLTSFVFQNQGAADNIVLTDAAGNVLDSIATSAGVPSDTVSVNWALTAGNTYWLIQDGGTNGVFTGYGAPLPSDSDIAITQSGSWGYSIGDVASNAYSFSANGYWADFNNITTGGAVPEPGAWAMMLLGLFSTGAVLRSRRKLAGAAAIA